MRLSLVPIYDTEPKETYIQCSTGLAHASVHHSHPYLLISILKIGVHKQSYISQVPICTTTHNSRAKASKFLSHWVEFFKPVHYGVLSLFCSLDINILTVLELVNAQHSDRAGTSQRSTFTTIVNKWSTLKLTRIQWYVFFSDT